MDTAQKLLQAWTKDLDRTEWFLNSHGEITRGSANQFLDSLSEPELPPTVQQKTQSGSNPDESSRHESPPKDEVEGNEFSEPSSFEDDDPGIEAIPTLGATVPSDWADSQQVRDGDENVLKDELIPVRGVYDPDSQIIRIILNGKVTVSIKDGEEGQIRLSEII